MMNDDKLKQYVNSSGFPMQIGLENFVNNTSSDHGWKVLYKEHSWYSPYSSNSGFIDLVLIDRRRTSIMVIECKRVQNTNWIFLLSSEDQERRRHVKVWISRFDGENKKFFDWNDVAVSPSSPESEFCVIPGQDRKSRPMIEKVAAELVEATEALSLEDYHLYKAEMNFIRMYFNVIVTTADLNLCSFNPDNISTDTGMIDKAEFRPVPFVRFRKSLSTKPVDQLNLSEKSPYHLSKTKENTVFIVNSTHFSDFLRTIEVDDI